MQLSFHWKLHKRGTVISKTFRVTDTDSAKDQARGVPMVADTHNEINQTSSFQRHSLSLARCTNHLPTANPNDNCIQNQILVYAADVLSCWCPLRVTCIRAVHCIRVQWLTSTTRNRLQLSWSGAQLLSSVWHRVPKRELNHPQSGPCLTNKHIIISIVITIIPWCNVCRTFILELDHSWVMPLYSGGKTLYQRWARSGKEEIRPRGTLFIQVPKKWSPSKELWASDPISSCPS